jgi:polyribonucleotide nucleotidyltransferase
MVHRKEIEIGGRILSIETGKVAKQTNGAAWIQYGDTIVLAAAVADKKPDLEKDFFPLTIDYREKTSAAGKIPGGFFKREGKPSEKEVLSARLIDRPIRPLFPDWYHNETQVLVTVLSSDGENDGDFLGAIAASAALSVSDIPLTKSVAEVRVGRIEGKFIINPTYQQLEGSDLEIVVAGSADSIMMVEGECEEISEGILVGAINFAHDYIKQIIQAIEELSTVAGKVKMVAPEPEDYSQIETKVRDLVGDRIDLLCKIPEKTEREDNFLKLEEEVILALAEEFPAKESVIKNIIGDIEKAQMRQNILKENRRLDGRSEAEIRAIECEVGILPRTHGSALFTRGQTQALATTTLGSRTDEQRLDNLIGEYTKRFLLHYNFPGYSTGEISKGFGVSRREIGHGNLAERALKAVIPSFEEFPYTIRVVSDILESNGSSSMATVCAGCLALMDSGVPLRKPVAGIAMGLVMEGNQYVILTDIIGAEDHLGDMDFKVAGTREGITAIQMDIKIGGISSEVISNALHRAEEARIKILDIMAQTLDKPRPALSPYAPAIMFIKIDIDKIGLIIGPGGKTIRDITEKSGAEINIENDGTIQIVSPNQQGAFLARDIIMGMVEEPEIGKIYEGTVKKIADFGAFVEILPGREGLLHISNIEHYRVNRVTDVLKVGDKVKVKLLDLDSQGKMDLSRKALLERKEGDSPSPYHKFQHSERRERSGSGFRGRDHKKD